MYQELKRVEVYTKRIEDATARKVHIDGKSLESAENRLKNVLADFELSLIHISIFVLNLKANRYGSIISKRIP